jgi:hypothetical protein
VRTRDARVRSWHRRVRIASAVLLIAWCLMDPDALRNLGSVVAEHRDEITAFVAGAVAMLVFDRLVLLPAAVLLARLGDWWNGRFQSR